MAATDLRVMAMNQLGVLLQIIHNRALLFCFLQAVERITVFAKLLQEFLDLGWESEECLVR